MHGGDGTVTSRHAKPAHQATHSRRDDDESLGAAGAGLDRTASASGMLDEERRAVLDVSCDRLGRRRRMTPSWTYSGCRVRLKPDTTTSFARSACPWRCSPAARPHTHRRFLPATEIRTGIRKTSRIADRVPTLATTLACRSTAP